MRLVDVEDLVAVGPDQGEGEVVASPSRRSWRRRGPGCRPPRAAAACRRGRPRCRRSAGRPRQGSRRRRAGCRARCRRRCRRRRWGRAPGRGPGRPWSAARCPSWNAATSGSAAGEPAAASPTWRSIAGGGPLRRGRARSRCAWQEAGEEPSLARLDRPVGAGVRPPGPGERRDDRRADARPPPARLRAEPRLHRGEPAEEPEADPAEDQGAGQQRAAPPPGPERVGGDVEAAPGVPGAGHRGRVLPQRPSRRCPGAAARPRCSASSISAIIGTVTSTHRVITARAHGVSTRFSGAFQRCGSSPSRVGRMRW